MINNLTILRELVDEKFDGDTFWYTELLDRRHKTGGNNRVRLVRTFMHRSRAELDDQFHIIQAACEASGARAYFRPSPRSYETVGRLFTTSTVEAALVGHWEHMAHIYASACGSTSIHGRKLWLYDVDEVNASSRLLAQILHLKGFLVMTVPTRKGVHLLAKPHDPRHSEEYRASANVGLHKDNPTILYAPDSELAPENPHWPEDERTC